MAKRRLKTAAKVQLFGLAMKKFTDTSRRAAEDEAGRNFADAIIADWKKNLSAAVPFLELMGTKRAVKTVNLPEAIPVLAIGQTFTRPDSVEVKRNDRMILMEAAVNRHMNANEDNTRHFVNLGQDRPYIKSTWRSAHGRELVKSLDLSEAIFLDVSTLVITYALTKAGEVEEIELRVNNNAGATWISKKTLDLLLPFYEAGRERAAAENNLWRSIGKLIWTSHNFEDLLVYWPEAKLLEADLFPVESLGALVPISAVEQAALCQNMSSRGVEAPVCKIAA